ncbi:MAG: aminopeptidase P family protein [Lachnospiraceae bacterium]|nr:aminopeptidase P family protein [Lachnospiraceae bacterium]
MRTDSDEIRNRIRMLRMDMERNGITVLLMKSTDPHASEYIGEHDKVTEFFSGCTSDNVVLAVTADEARLWTDGRYFISAARELSGTDIQLMKSGRAGVPKVTEYLKERLSQGDVLGFDGRCIDAASGLEYRRTAASAGASVEGMYAPAEEIWVGRPQMSCSPVWFLPDGLSGRSFGEKLSDVREKMKASGASYYMMSSLDDIMWLFNMRGSDVACCPVAYAYCLVGTGTCDLFIQDGAVTEELAAFARANRVKVHSYGSLFAYLGSYHFEGNVLVNVRESSDALYSVLKSRAALTEAPGPAGLLKAVKNGTEIARLKECYLADSAAVCRFIFSMKNRIGRETVTEYTAAEAMDAERRALPGFLDLSFPTISAYNANAAMAHYAVNRETAEEVKPEGFLLVDSGGQYMGGTTDVTRTIAAGSLTEEMKRDFTLVACANLRLLDARFREGTTGSQLDMIPREVLYRHGIDYDHGTGHGIGYILNVHEGPQRIGRSTGSDPAMEAGMITSDEPGIYREGEYGIRTESIMLCVEDRETEFGRFLKFEPLTFVPIDLSAIDTKYMEAYDIRLLNEYHRQVREKIGPLLTGDARDWLLEAAGEVRA